MFKVNAFSKKGTKIRFRITGNDIHAVRKTLSTIFDGQEMRLILVVPI